jgi:hypothetical protein
MPNAAAGRGDDTTVASKAIPKITPIFRMTRHLKKLEGVATSNARTTINVPLVALVPMDHGRIRTAFR